MTENNTKPLSENTNENKTEEPKRESLLDKAEALRLALEDKENKINKKIEDFEKMLAERVLSGKTDFIPEKSQQEKDDEEANKTVKRFLG